MERTVVTGADLRLALQDLGIGSNSPLIVHASLSAFGYVQGGCGTLLEALLASFDTLVMPVFTFKTMLTPLVGPPCNALDYHQPGNENNLAEFFHPHMPADPLMGALPEALRTLPGVQRSSHPILSFAGWQADAILAVQTLAEPLAPVGELAAAGGWVLLLGVDQTVNTSLHYAESLAGRLGFLRWALTKQMVVECPGFPGCSDGFNAITPRSSTITRHTLVGGALIQALPLVELIHIAREWIEADPLAMLCERQTCARCDTIRKRSKTR